MKTKIIFSLLLLGGSYALMSDAIAQTTVTLQPSSALGKDACIWSNGANSNQDYESLTAYGWTNNGNPGIKRALLEFDLSSLPPNITIVNAELSLYYNPTDNVESVDFHSGSNAALVQRIISPWNETAVTWNTQPSTTSQNEVTLPQSTSGTQDYLNINVTNLVSDMVSDLANSHGFMLRMINENPYNILIFASSDHPNAVLHPKLEITYIIPCTNLTLQPSSALGKDACIWSNGANSNQDYESLTAYGWTNNGNPGTKRALFEFDLSSLPSNITVADAELSLYYNLTDNVESVDFHSGSNAALVQRIISPWNETSVTWNTQPPTTGQNEVMLPQSTSGTEDYLSIDVTNLVSDMVNDLANSHGFMLRMINENPYNILLFASSDHPNSALHPKLEICYVEQKPSSVNDETDAGADLYIYPNPAASEFKIQNSELKIERIELYNLLGEKVYSRQPETSNQQPVTVNVSALTPGVYFVHLAGEKKHAVRKVIVQR